MLQERDTAFCFVSEQITNAALEFLTLNLLHHS